MKGLNRSCFLAVYGVLFCILRGWGWCGSVIMQGCSDALRSRMVSFKIRWLISDNGANTHAAAYFMEGGGNCWPCPLIWSVLFTILDNMCCSDEQMELNANYGEGKSKFVSLHSGIYQILLILLKWLCVLL